MRVSLSAAVLAMLGFLPSLAFGLALGEIKLNSALNEPLDAEIEVQAAAQDELDNLSARIAPRETFERYGLDRPDFLSGLVFTVERVGGRDILRVRSRQAIAEPFVTFLVEAQWRRGRLLREYTVLLDPPVFMPVPETAAPAAAPAPVFAPRSAPVARPVERPGPAPRRFAATPLSYSGDYGPIRRGETLWSIAERLRGDSSLTMNQIMVAIYRANQQEFLGNINLIKEGSVLRIPDRATIAALAQPEAFATAVAHNEAWRAGRPSQVARVATAPAPAVAPATDTDRLRLVEPDLTRSGAAATGGGDDAATRAALARNEAELTRLATENDQLRGDLEEIRRLISLKDTELAELQRQLTGTAPAISPAPSAGTDDVAGAVDPVTDTVATGTGTPGSTGVDTGPSPDTVTADTGAVDPVVAGTTDTTAADPAAVDAAVDDTTTTRPADAPLVSTSLPDQKGFFATMIDSTKGLLGSLWLWIALGVLALAAFAAVFLRGRAAGEPDALDALVAESDQTAIVRRPTITTGAPDEDVEFFEDSGTFKPVDFASTQVEGETAEYPFEDTIGAGAGIKLDQSDPMAEADFHLAYGLYDQAADLVRKAVAREPERVDLRMKLLEIFFVWGNQEEFRATAQDLHDNMSEQIAGEWDKIVIMGKQICPEDELFAGGTGMSTGADIDLEFDTSAAPGIDFDTSGSPEAAAPDADHGLDLEFGDVAGDDSVADVAGSGGADVLLGDDDDGLDFDLGLELPPADDEDDDTRPEPVDELKDQIKARLSSTDNEETAEMDLSDLGVDLDLGGTADPGSADGFGDAFGIEAADPTSEMPAPTAELTAGAKGLDLDIGDVFGGLDSEDDDETARDLDALEESMETTAPHELSGGDDETGHFSAEIETLHGDALDVDISGFEEDEHGRTRLIDDDEPTGGHTEDAFSASVFGETTDEAGETRMIGPETTPEEDPFSDVFGVSEDAETVLAESPGIAHDGMETDIFGLQTGSQPVDLDIGEAMEADGEDKTTVKVPAADMALPGGDDELSEVGTKLDLARAYMDMGDPDGARGILEEVIAEGDETQQADARELLEALS